MEPDPKLNTQEECSAKKHTTNSKFFSALKVMCIFAIIIYALFPFSLYVVLFMLYPERATSLEPVITGFSLLVGVVGTIAGLYSIYMTLQDQRRMHDETNESEQFLKRLTSMTEETQEKILTIISQNNKIASQNEKLQEYWKKWDSAGNASRPINPINTWNSSSLAKEEKETPEAKSETKA